MSFTAAMPALVGRLVRELPPAQRPLIFAKCALVAGIVAAGFRAHGP